MVVYNSLTQSNSFGPCSPAKIPSYLKTEADMVIEVSRFTVLKHSDDGQKVQKRRVSQLITNRHKVSSPTFHCYRWVGSNSD